MSHMTAVRFSANRSPMNHQLWIVAAIALLTACSSEKASAPTPTPTATATATAAPTSSASTTPAVAKPEPVVWEAVTDLDSIGGTWVDAKKGDSHPAGKLIDGGVRVEFVKGRKGSRTPWNLRFWAPRSGHMGSDTVSGGCGFYDDPKNGERAAFCKGYGLGGDKSHQLKLMLGSKDDGKQLHVRIGNLLDEVVVRP